MGIAIWDAAKKMTRPLKFRVWERPGIVASSTEGSTEFKGKMHLQDDWSFWGYALSRPEEYELMQWTYLNDKNGKEIYESDKITFNGQPKESVVEWLDNVGCWGINGHPLGAAAKMSEVIGNIYENPSLLTPESK